jgi:fusaric acid resistance family protein
MQGRSTTSASGNSIDVPGLSAAASSAMPRIMFGLRLWVSVCLALLVAYWLQLDDAYWAGTSASIVAQPGLGASLQKGRYRAIGTVVGAVVIVLLTALFPQNHVGFLLSLTLWERSADSLPRFCLTSPGMGLHSRGVFERGAA